MSDAATSDECEVKRSLIIGLSRGCSASSADGGHAGTAGTNVIRSRYQGELGGGRIESRDS